MSKLRLFFLLDTDLLSIFMTLTHISQPDPGGSSARPLGYGIEKNRDIPSGWKRKSLKPSGKAPGVQPTIKLVSTPGLSSLRCGDRPKGEIVAWRLREKLPLRVHSWHQVDERTVGNLREIA